MKRLVITTLATGVCMTSITFAQSYDSKQQWYDQYMEAEYEKETMFNLINQINVKYNKNVVYLQPVDFEVSYYTDLNCENGFGPINCKGEKLVQGMVANNVLSLGTQIYLPELGLKTVADRGSDKYFSKFNAIDVFVPRNPGESDKQYYKRVNNLGRHTVRGYILKEE